MIILFPHIDIIQLALKNKILKLYIVARILSRPSRLREGVGWAVSTQAMKSAPKQNQGGNIIEIGKFSPKAKIHLHFAAGKLSFALCAIIILAKQDYHSRQRRDYHSAAGGSSFAAGDCIFFPGISSTKYSP